MSEKSTYEELEQVEELEKETSKHGQVDAELERIEWLLTKSVKRDPSDDESYDPPYGNLAEMNTFGVLINSVGSDVLTDIVSDYLDLLDTSAAVYEKNGNYALGIFSSGWCQLLDTASRNLCGTEDNSEALESGKWLCHESCWTEASKISIETGQSVDIECNGGIRLYAVPIHAGKEIVGSINFGYGDPPSEPQKLQEISEKYCLRADELIGPRESYETRPTFIIEIAKRRLASSARLIGAIVERRQTEKALRQAYDELEQRVEERTVELVKANEKLKKEIDERKQAEEQLRDSEEKYRTLSSNIPGMVYRGTSDWSTEIISNCEMVCGYSISEFSSQTVKWLDLIHPDDKQRVFEEGSKLIEKPKSIVQEYRILAKNGSTRWVNDHKTSFFKEDGSFIGVDGCVYDITERKLGEEALRESEERFRYLSDSSPIGVFETDKNGSVKYLNNKWLAITGMSLQDALGFGWGDALHPEDRPRILANWTKCLEEKIGFDGEFRFVRPSGEVRWVRTRTSPVFSLAGDVISHVGVNEDITERKQADEALLKSEEKYKDLFNNINDLIQSIDLNGHFLQVNKKWKEILGYNEEDLVKLSIWDIIHPDCKGHCEEIFKKVISGRVVNDAKVIFVSKNGNVVNVEGNINCRFEGARVVSSIGVFRDVRKRKQMEEEKAELQNKLQQAQKMEAIATLAGGIAHQFNNALSPVSMNLEMLGLDYPNDEKIANYTNQMKDSVHRMALLTSQLLAYAKGGKYQTKTISINDFTENTLQIISHVINPDISIETNLTAEVLNIKADQTQMQMVLSAILANASEAIEDKGHIRISTKKEEIDEDFVKYHPDLKPGPHVCLIVEDNGKGMDKETRDRIFEPFFTTKFQGRGLGMASAFGIVKNHDGQISVYSEMDRGTVVRIYLPAVEALVGEPKKPKIEPITTKSTGTILVIEDEQMVMDVTRALLEKLGYHVLAAMTGKEAVNIAKTFDGEIDLAILDMVLPDMGGKAIYPLMMEARSNLKVIVCSGYSIDGPAQEVLDAGAQDFIQKPFTMATLSERLKKIL